MTRAARLTTTRSGLQIGLAYTKPPHRPGSEAERIQHLLLSKRRAPGASDYLAAALALLCLRIANAWSENNFVRLYCLHRERVGRWQSFCGALRCLPF